MRNSGLEEAQAGIKIAGRNINNLRYGDEEELLKKAREWKSWLKTQKTKIMASGPFTLLQIDGETMETARDFIFLGSTITADGDCSHEVKDICSLEEKLRPT